MTIRKLNLLLLATLLLVSLPFGLSRHAGLAKEVKEGPSQDPLAQLRESLQARLQALGYSNKYAGRLLDSAVRWGFERFVEQMTADLTKRGLTGAAGERFLADLKHYLMVLAS